MASKSASATEGVLFRPSAFWTPDYLTYSSVWFEHGPFAFWLMDVLRPRCFVELGTHAGYSYFCFCQAVQRLHLGTSCYAVDTWLGDEHSGFYGEDVFRALSKHNQLYISFSTLIRSTFDDALGHFPDKSVDLLHIDGRHFYEDARHYFESWRGKLTNHAIILFHDTNVRERQFGVWKLFEELKQSHPTFNFIHGNGLGAVAFKKIPSFLKTLFEFDEAATDEWRQAFAILGSAVTQKWQASFTQVQLQDQVASYEQENLQAQLVQKQLQEQVANSEQDKLRAKRDRERFVAEVQNLTQKNERAPTIEEKNAILIALSSQNHKLQKQRSWLRKAWSRLKEHFSQNKAILNVVRESPLFDASWYLTTYTDVASSNTNPAKHYFDFGASEGRDPGPFFPTREYFRNNSKNTDFRRVIMRHFLSWSGSFRSSQKTPKTPSLALPLGTAIGLSRESFKIAVFLHCFYIDLIAEIAEYLANISVPFDLFISTDTLEKETAIREHPLSDKVRKIEIRIVPNRGRDIAPKLVTFADVFAKYDLALFIHTKRSLHHAALTDWRKVILSQLMGTKVIVNDIIGLFSTFPDLGIVAPKHFEPILGDINWGVNWDGAKQLAGRLDIRVKQRVPIDFPSGSMFWVRPGALVPLLNLKLKVKDFESEQGQQDGTLGHQLERLFYFACEKAGYRWLEVARPELFQNRSKIVHAVDIKDCERVLRRNLLQSHAR